LLLLVAGIAAPARAQETATPAKKVAPVVRPAHEYRVDFSAERVEVDGDLHALELQGNVRVQAQRYRLSSDRLQLTRWPRGVEAQGASNVAFCPCDDPPVLLRVKNATLAPPTDALFDQTTLEVFGLPVFWLPALWLRAPTRLGLIFPRLAYRGADGLFAGTGVYVPLQVSDGRVTRSLALAGGAYSAGGARLEGEFDSEASTSRVAWDHVQHSALEIDAHGSAALSEAQFAYHVSALRGERARVEPSSLEVASRRTDRATASVSHVDEFALGFALRADAPRAGAFRDFGAVGPELYLGAARDLGPNAAYDAFASARTSSVAGNHAKTGLTERATLTANARPGPFGLGLTLAQAGDLEVSERRSDGLVRAGAEARASLPLLRSFGSISHFVEPLIVARGIVDGAPRGSSFNSTHTLVVAGGVDTSLGERSSRHAASLSVRGGALQASQAGGAPELVAMARVAADTHYLMLAESQAVLGAEPTLVSLSRARIGAADQLHLALRADGASHGSPARARLLFDESWFDWPRPFVDRNGWSAGSELAVPWPLGLTSSASADYDLTARALLAVWGGLGYRHPCGCLAISSFVGHRVGREGIDAWVGFDLAP